MSKLKQIFNIKLPRSQKYRAAENDPHFWFLTSLETTFTHVFVKVASQYNRIGEKQRLES